VPVVFIAPVLILAVALAVPLAYRHFWPVKLKRPRLFLGITLAMGLLLALGAIAWFSQVLVGVGIAHATPAGAASSQAALQAALLNRFLVAASFTVVVEYLLCRITQTLLGVNR
jgi:hypothetical protein